MSLATQWKHLRRWSRALALAAGLGLAGQSLRAQDLSATPVRGSTSKYVVKNTTFHLPFRMDRANTGSVREMHLWMRDPAGQWRLIDRVPPTANYFSCRVPRDGDYGFSIVTVDARGIPSPADVTRRPPELEVIVETRLPMAPPIAPVTQSPKTSSLPPITQVSAPPAPIAPRAPMTPVAPLTPSMPPPVNDTIILNDTPPPVVTGPRVRKSAVTPTYKIPDVDEPLDIPLDETSPSPAVTRSAPRPVRQQEPPQAIPDALDLEDIEPETVKETPAVVESTGSHPVVLLVNNQHVSIDYNIKKTGPSGISKVYIYATQDQGQTWRRLGEDSDLHSPADIDLPGEGTYGIRMVGINGNGFGSKAPAAGDRPATTIEVDVTKPKIQGWKVGLAKNQIEVRWKVSDKNLAKEPINLYYSTKRGGPWKPMGLKLKNDGCYHWSMSKELSPQYFIRLEAVDMAGNTATCESQSPLMVDRTPPDINVTGVSVIRTTSTTETPGTLVPATDSDE